MIFRLNSLVLGLLTALALSSGNARAEPIDDYVTLMTALSVDKACGGLKYMESQQARSTAYTVLAQTPEYQKAMNGSMPSTNYDAWIAEVEARISSAASGVGCTQQALQYILPAKSVASEALYRGLVLAFYFDAATDFMVSSPLDDHEKQAASRYDGYLQQLYGQNFQAFSKAQHDLAMRELPDQELNIFDPLGTNDPLGIGGGLDLMAYSSAKSLAYQAMNAVQFEVTAEANGLLVRPRDIDANLIIPELRSAAGAQLPVVDGPGYRLVFMPSEEGTPRAQTLYSITAVKPDGALRVLFYGASAAKLETPTVRLYVRSQPRPDGVSDYDTFKRTTFREEATAFDAERASEGCLGAPCYDFPLEASAAMLANPEGYLAEFFVSPEAGATPPEITESTTDRKYLDNRLLLKLLR